jgi:hypothetical protein
MPRALRTVRYNSWALPWNGTKTLAEMEIAISYACSSEFCINCYPETVFKITDVNGREKVCPVRLPLKRTKSSLIQEVP